jgi:hypothetical protein
MTRIGKVLIFINLALSVGFLAWTVGLVTNRIYWNTPPADGGEKVVGQVDQLKARIKDLVEARSGTDGNGGADLRWYYNTQRLHAVEAERPRRQAYYREQLKIVQTGTDLAGKPVEPPVQQLAFAPDGRLNWSKKTGQPPVRIDGQPALSVQGYERKTKATLEEMNDDQKTVAETVKKIAGLTQQLNASRGLRERLAEQEDLARNTKAEIAYLQTPLTTYTVETQLLKRRQNALEGRLRELAAATGTAVGLR